MLEGKLQRAGLSPNEAKIYSILLDLGKSTLARIARSAGLSHVTVLFILRRLLGKDLVYKVVEGKQKYYFIRAPKHGLRRYLQLLREEMDAKEKAVMDAIEGAEIKFASLEGKPEVKFFEGEESTRGVQLEIENTVFDELYEFTHLDSAFRAVSKHRRDEHKKTIRLSKKKYHSYTIYTTSEGQKYPRKWKRRYTYYIPHNLFNFHGEISVFGDKVAFIGFEPHHMSAIIHNKTIATTMKQFFKLAIIGSLHADEVLTLPFQSKYEVSPSAWSETYRR